MEMFENNKSNNKSDNSSIKDNIITILKESMKFALVGVAIFMIFGVTMLYLLIDILKIQNVEMAALIVGIIAAILIVIVDVKKLHTTDKMAECNRRIFIRIYEKISEKWKIN